MSLVLDAGAFLAVELGDRDVIALVKREQLAGRSPISHGGSWRRLGEGEVGDKRASLG